MQRGRAQLPYLGHTGRDRQIRVEQIIMSGNLPVMGSRDRDIEIARGWKLVSSTTM